RPTSRLRRAAPLQSLELQRAPECRRHLGRQVVALAAHVVDRVLGQRGEPRRDPPPLCPAPDPPSPPSHAAALAMVWRALSGTLTAGSSASCSSSLTASPNARRTSRASPVTRCS